MKTIHDQIIELLSAIEDLKDKGIEVSIICIPPEIKEIPDAVTESLAECYLESATEFYKDDNNMKAYEKWKQEQEEQKKITA